MLTEAQQQHERVVHPPRVGFGVHRVVHSQQVGIYGNPQLSQVGVLAGLAQLLDGALVGWQRAQLVAQQPCYLLQQNRLSVTAVTTAHMQHCRTCSALMSLFSSALDALLSRYCWIRSASQTSVATVLGLLCLQGCRCQGASGCALWCSKRTERRVRTKRRLPPCLR